MANTEIVTCKNSSLKEVVIEIADGPHVGACLSWEKCPEKNLCVRRQSVVVIDDGKPRKIMPDNGLIAD